MQSEFAESTKSGILPSGKTYEDYLLFVRQAMYKELGNSVIDVVDDEDDVSDRVDDDNPSTMTAMKDTEMKERAVRIKSSKGTGSFPAAFLFFQRLKISNFLQSSRISKYCSYGILNLRRNFL